MSTADQLGEALRRKELATLMAQLALRGFSLHELADGSFLACKWGLMSHPLRDLHAVAQFAAKVGAR